MYYKVWICMSNKVAIYTARVNWGQWCQANGYSCAGRGGASWAL